MISGVKRLSNFIEVSTREIANLARIVGKNDVSKLDKDDMVSVDPKSFQSNWGKMG